MTDTITKRLGKIFAWLVVAVITLSFAAWGIGDIFRGRNNNWIARVGDSPVYYEDYSQALKFQSQKFSKILGNQPLPEDIRKEILNGLVRQKLLLNEVKNLGLEVSDDIILQIIAENPNFRDEKGKFSTKLFNNFLQENNQSEKSYSDYLKQEIGYFNLVQAILSDKAPPKAKLVNAYNIAEEQREVEVVYLPAELPVIAQPKDYELNEFYNSHRQDFSAPEIRDISYLVIDPAKLKKTEVSDSELKNIYEKNKAEFSESETRDLSIILAPTREEAEKYGKNFKGGKLSVLKKVKKENVPAALADAAFKLSKNQTSEPVQTPFGWHIVRVDNVYAPHVRSFEEVKGELQTAANIEANAAGATKLIQEIDDEAASGAKIDDVAKKYGLEIKKSAGIKQSEKEFTESPEFLKTAFSTASGSSSNVVPLKSGKYAIIYVDTVTPVRTKTLDEVKGAAEEAWKKSKARDEARTKAEEFIKKSSGGFSVPESSLKRFSDLKPKDKRLPQNLVQAIFSVKENEITKPFEMDNKLLVARVTKIKRFAGNADANALSGLKNQLTEENADDLLTQYFSYLQTKYPVEINRELFERN